MKGIILAGGSGSRLHPITDQICKQLLPIYDKPMIFYPLSTLVYLGITEILIISSPRDLPKFEDLLGNGKKYGISLQYAVQEEPKGLAQAFTIGEEFIGDDSVSLILGDNIFYGSGEIINSVADNVTKMAEGALVLAYHVQDPERYGVVEFAKDGTAISLEEKPEKAKSNWAVTGLYFYDNKVIEYAKSLKPSARGELEITDINKIYLEKQTLKVEKLKRGFAWLDTGTPDSLLEAASFVHTIQHRQGLKICCLEEVCYRKKLIDRNQLLQLAEQYSKNNEYGKYLKNIANLSD